MRKSVAIQLEEKAARLDSIVEFISERGTVSTKEIALGLFTCHRGKLYYQLDELRRKGLIARERTVDQYYWSIKNAAS